MKTKTRALLRLFILFTTTLGLIPEALAQSHGAPDSNTVLIYGPGTSKSVWQQAAAAAGFTVEVATDTSWNQKTTEDFATYRTIVVPDNWCDGPGSTVVNSRSIWGPAVDGNVLIVGGDPDFHTASSWPASGGQAEVGAAQLIYNGIAFSGNWAGHTGAYLPLGCSATVTVLEPFGTFSAVYSGSDSVHLVASHPALEGLTDANQSNWYSSTHSGFTAYPDTFIPLAIQDGSTSSPCFADGHCGYPYLLARGNGLQPAGLNIQKSGPTEADAGATITYTITYGNTGGTAATGVVVSDPIPAGTSYVAGSASDGGSLSGSNVVWSIGTVDAGSINNTRTFQVTIVQSSGAITNAGYSIVGDGLDPVVGADVVTTVLPPPASTITASAAVNGSITPSGSVSVNNGEDQTFTITPDAHYHVLDVIVDGASVGAVTSYTFTNVTAAHSISATFAIDTNVIAATAGTGGSISPSGDVSVDYDASQSFTILPDAHTHILDVLVDGSTVGAAASYTFDNVIAPHSIAASFTIDQYTITVNAGANGVVDCPTPIDHGGSATCTITPAAGYVLDVLTDNGAGVLAEVSGDAYTISDVTAAHTIVAAFKMGLGTSCSGASDCHSGFCADGVCCDTACNGEPDDCNACSVAAGAATDGVCGPSTGNSCSDGSLCTLGDTCDNGTCAGSAVVCTALDECHVAGSCQESDGTCTNPDETDGVACDGGLGECTGGVCKPANGQACSDDSGCASGHCADDVCCDTACAGQCEACAEESQEGTCVPVSGAPRNDRIACEADGSVCDGTCDGIHRAACVYAGAETECRAASCSDGVATLAASCNGAGACPAPETTDCGFYACGEAACNGDCQADLDCAAGNWCSGGVCAPKKDSGASCASDNECLSSHCADGVCCDTACSGQCEACDDTDAVGTCVPVSGAPRNGRTPCVADGSACDGYCDGDIADSCAYPDLSVTCREASCEDGVATLAATCDGTGVCPAVQVQSCGAYQCGQAQCLGECIVDDDCAASYWCNAGICEPEKDAGAGCGGANQCASGHCVDGVCCNDACSGQCEACNGTDTAGECLPVLGEPRGARPACASDDSSCGGACDGELRTACAYPDVETECRAASCSDGIATLAASCNGSGACPDVATQSCGMYDCADVACRGDCQVDGDCAAGHWCSGGICAPTKEQGSLCGAANECVTGLCVDGTCCDRACDGQCEACAEPGNEGTCLAAVGAPRASRTPCATDRSACGGACDGTNGIACTYPGTSVICSPAVCEAGVATPAALCDGAGSCAAAERQSCGPYACAGDACGAGCVTDADCGASHVCFEGSCVTEAEVLAEKDRRLDELYGVAGSGLSCAGGTAQPWTALVVALLALGFAVRRRRSSVVLSVALLVALAGVARAAEVSTDILLQRFQPASGFSDILAVQAAPQPGRLRLGFSASFNYGKAPLRLVGSADQRDRMIVSQQTGLDVGATLGLLDRWEISVVLPVTVDQENGRASLVDPRFGSSGASAGVSDVRISPKARLASLGDFTFAVAAPLALPTGDDSSYNSGGTSFNPMLISEWSGRVRVVANVGVVLRGSRDLVGLKIGPALSYGAGMEMPVAVKNQEVAGLLTVVGETGLRAVDLSSTPLELLAAVRWRGASGLTVTLGGGPGLTTGYGTPRYRLLASLGFVPFSVGESSPAASEELTDEPASLAPSPSPSAVRPEPVLQPDPIEPEPEAPLVESETADPDATVTPAPTTADEDENDQVVMEESRIVTLEKVFFDTGRDTVADKSRAVLAQVAATLVANPQIRLLRVEGHTDNQGPSELNVDLSSRRAAAVRDILIQEGVAPERLEAVGLGSSRPIDTNESTRGRANNRRVEFIVVERDAVASDAGDDATSGAL